MLHPSPKKKGKSKKRSGKDPKRFIKVICVSDTHNDQPPIQPGDILLHTGDLTDRGTFDELQAQLTWLSSQPHPHKFVIGGNHDKILDQNYVLTHPERNLSHPGKSAGDLNWGTITYLQQSSSTITIKGQKLKIWGSPMTVKDNDGAFRYKPWIDVWSRLIPRDVDIVMCHGPPVMHLDDKGKGCKFLLRELWHVKPKLVAFGHIHQGRGREVVDWSEEQRNREARFLGKGEGGGIWKTVLGLLFKRYEGQGRETVMVNAAVAGKGRNRGSDIVEL